MQEPPGLERFLDYPVTAGTGLLAAICTLCVYADVDMSALAMSVEAFHGEPWRLFSSPLIHENLPHLFAGMFFLWAFGAPVEHRWGHACALVVLLSLAAGASAAEFAFLEGGHGLSPVVCGLLALNVAAGTWPRAALAAVAFLAVGKVFNLAGLIDVPLAGEIAGTLTGAAFGAGSRATGPDRIPGIALAPLVVALALAAATTGRATLNLAGRGDESTAHLGRLALGRGSSVEAESHYRRAVEAEPNQASNWAGLGESLLMDGRASEAEAAFERAWAAGPYDNAARQALADCRLVVASELQAAGRYEEAEAAYLRALRLRPADTFALWNLGLCRLRLGRIEEARGPLLRAELDPEGLVFPVEPPN